MPQHKKELIKFAIEKSKTALQTAKENMASKKLEGALNRIYYAIFYAVSALAIKNDFSTSNHSQLIGWFNKKFIHEDKVFDKEIYRIYESSFAYRQKSDYDLTYIPDLDTVQTLLSKAEFFIDAIIKTI